MSMETIVLPQTLDLTAVGALRDDVRARRGKPIEFDASQVQRVGGLCLQVLIAAKRDWAAAGVEARFGARSAEFDEAVRLLGAGPFLGLAQTTEI